MAEHKDLPNSELHEPKGVSTADSGMVYIANGSGSGEWVRPTGWDNKRDSVYIETSTLAIDAGVESKVLIDGVAGTLGQGLDVWGTSVNKIVSEGENFVYNTRLTFKCKATNTGYIDVIYRSGGVDFVTKTIPYQKGGSVVNNIVSSLEVFTGALTVSEGGLEIYIKPSKDIEVWDYGIFITRAHYAY